jgi:Zn-dependent protease
MPLRIHVSTLFVLLALRSHVRSPLAWLTWLAMVALHEIGHGALARREGGRVVELVVHGLGGECRYVGVRTREGQERVAWGGVLAQALLAIAALLALWANAPVPAAVTHVALTLNAWSILFNLLPIAPLDGALAWSYLARLWRRARAKIARLASRREEPSRIEAPKEPASPEEIDRVTDTREADALIHRVLGISTEERERR